MENPEDVEYPGISGGDVALSLVRAAIAAIPFAGGSAAGLFSNAGSVSFRDYASCHHRLYFPETAAAPSTGSYAMPSPRRLAAA